MPRSAKVSRQRRAAEAAGRRGVMHRCHPRHSRRCRPAMQRAADRRRSRMRADTSAPVQSSAVGERRGAGASRARRAPATRRPPEPGLVRVRRRRRASRRRRRPRPAASSRDHVADRLRRRRAPGRNSRRRRASRRREQRAPPAAGSRTAGPARAARAGSRRVADARPAAPRGEGADAVGHQPVGRPVAAADDVAGARRGDRDARLAPGTSARQRAGDQLGAGLARAVGVVAAQRVVFAVGPRPLAVLVALVGGDDDARRAPTALARTASSRCAVPMTLIANVSSGSA